MSKIAFICDENLKGLFEGFGIDSFILKTKEDLRLILEDIIKKDYSIIYILERFALNFLDIIEMLGKEKMISIVVVCDHISSLDLGITLTKRSTIDAIGTDAIFANGEER